MGEFTHFNEQGQGRYFMIRIFTLRGRVMRSLHSIHHQKTG